MYYSFVYHKKNWCIIENLTLRQKVSKRKNRTAGSPRFETPGFAKTASERMAIRSTNDDDSDFENMNSFENLDDVTVNIFS